MAALAMVVMAAGIVSCDSNAVAAYCQMRCDCSDCDDPEQEACEVYHRGGLHIADAYGCGAEARSLLDCVVEHSTCRDEGLYHGHVVRSGVTCDPHSASLRACVDANADYPRRSIFYFGVDGMM